MEVLPKDCRADKIETDTWFWERVLLFFTPFPSSCSTFPSLCPTQAIPSQYLPVPVLGIGKGRQCGRDGCSSSSWAAQVPGAGTPLPCLVGSLGGATAAATRASLAAQAEKHPLQQHIRLEFLHRMVTTAVPFFTGIPDLIRSPSFPWSYQS